MHVLVALAAFLAAGVSATPTTTTKCQYPPQIVEPGPNGTSKPCHNKEQTFSLQAVNCSSPYNGYYVEILAEAQPGLGAGTWQLNGEGTPAEFVSSNSTLYLATDTNYTNPLTAPYSNNGKGQSLISGPLQQNKPVKYGAGNAVRAIPCSIAKGYLCCTAPLKQGHIFEAEDLGGPPETTATVYLDNGPIPHNPNDGNEDYQFPSAMKIVNTCHLT